MKVVLLTLLVGLAFIGSVNCQKVEEPKPEETKPVEPEPLPAAQEVVADEVTADEVAADEAAAGEVTADDPLDPSVEGPITEEEVLTILNDEAIATVGAIKDTIQSPEEEVNAIQAEETIVENSRKGKMISQDKVKDYNAFIDAYLLKVSRQLQLSEEPMSLVIKKAAKNVKKAPNKKANNAKGKRQRGKKGRKGNKQRQQGREHPKDTRVERLGEVQEGDEEEEAVEEGPVRAKRNVDHWDVILDEDFDEDEEEEKLSRVTRDIGLEEDLDGDLEDDLEEDDLEAIEGEVEGSNREGRQKCRRKCRARRRRRKIIRRRNRLRKQRLRKQQQAASARKKRSFIGAKGEIFGLSNIRRVGDVKINNQKNKQVIISDFEIGPLTMKLSKTHADKENTLRTAEASTSIIQGKLAVTIFKSGKASLSNFILRSPQNVNIKGSLRLDQSPVDKLSERSFTRANPIIAKRLKKIAREALTISNQPPNQQKNQNRKNQNAKNKNRNRNAN